MKIIIIPALICGAIGWRILMNYSDKTRIIESGHEKGWRDITVSWDPFAPGAIFEKGERHYSVDYTDAAGKQCHQYCKTSMLTGVYWRE